MSFWGPWTHLYGYSLEPGVWIPIILGAFVYWRGRRQIARAQLPSDPKIGPWRAASFYVGLGIILFAVQGPVNYLAYYLFWIHMVEHCLLQMVAAPLLLVGAPVLPMWRGLPQRWRETLGPKAGRVFRQPILLAIGHFLRRPWVGLAALALTFWGWHVPDVFDFTFRTAAMHDLEFATLLVSGLLYWSQTVDSYPLRRQLTTWPLCGYLVAGTAVMWVVALSLGFSGHAWYSPYYLMTSRPLGISALTDQQWGAGVAWVPAAIPAEIMLDIVVLQWLRDDERKADAEVELYRRTQAANRDASTHKES